ncbi:MAG: DUF4351 domain-containing protein [Cyanobacteriota bacterium]
MSSCGARWRGRLPLNAPPTTARSCRTIGSRPDGRVAEGEARGEARGRAAEAVAVTLRLLSRRCGPLSEATTARIQALPLEKLEELAEALLDFTGAADLAAWLAEHAD